MTRILFLIFICFVFVTAAYGQEAANDGQPYAWDEANLALTVPSGWQVTSIEEVTLTLTLVNPEGELAALVRVDDTLATDEGVSTLLISALRELQLTSGGLTSTNWLGQPALETVASNGFGRAVAGRLPDRRMIAIAGRAETAEAAQTLFIMLRNSLVLSADAAPMPLTYAPVWQVALPAPQASPFDAPAPHVMGLTVQESRVYAVDAARGVLIFNLDDGALLATYPFPNPSQPTSLTVAENGTVYIGDAVCRCVQVMDSRGNWLDSLGAFGGNAPVQVVLAGGTLYAVDVLESGYIVRAITPARTRDIPLEFNTAAAPLLFGGSSDVFMVETLRSLLDETANRAFSRISADTIIQNYWLPSFNSAVNAAAVDETGSLFLALADGQMVQVSGTNNVTTLAVDAPDPRALAVSPEGLIIARADGTIIARSGLALPDRTGDGILLPNATYQGSVSETQPVQSWSLSGSADEVVNIVATDLLRRETLDVALRLFAPSGGEIAFNDDQLGVDVYGRFDPHIPDFRLPEDGVYRVQVEWIAGDGTYSLGYTVDQPLTLENEVQEITGTLQDVIPVQRWAFDGQAGQAFTVTMFVESGDLDPALELLRPDGTTFLYNDDTVDPEMGVNAQLVRVQLPENGRYVLEASRFDGAGRYRIVITPNN